VGQVFPKELMFVDIICILSLCFIIMNSDPKLYFSTQIKDMHLINNIQHFSLIKTKINIYLLKSRSL
jgi:hypothetical protein